MRSVYDTDKVPLINPLLTIILGGRYQRRQDFEVGQAKERPRERLTDVWFKEKGINEVRTMKWLEKLTDV